VAYYSDEGGEAGIFVWEKSAKQAERFPGVIPRSFFGFEILRWSSDSQRILCKILPDGMTMAQANALLPNSETPDRFPQTGPNEPVVIVFMSPGEPSEASRKGPGQAADLANRELGDLALLDLRSHRVTRIATHVKPHWWAFSPDEKYVAYTATLGWEPVTHSPSTRSSCMQSLLDNPGAGAEDSSQLWNRAELVARQPTGRLYRHRPFQGRTRPHLPCGWSWKNHQRA
jgi:hypothetical protein